MKKRSRFHETRGRHHYLGSHIANDAALAADRIDRVYDTFASEDIVESANLVIRRPRTATIVLGGGTPTNFINQASVQAQASEFRSWSA